MIYLPVLAVLVTVAFSASIDQNKMLEIVKTNFLNLDANKDNPLDYNEFMGYYHRLDVNHDDHLQMTEFMKSSGDSSRQAMIIYKMFDMDYDRDFTPNDIQNIFKKFDANGDGIVVYEEFLKVEERVLTMMIQYGTGNSLTGR